MNRYHIDGAALNPQDNGGECVEVAVEIVDDDMRRIAFSAHSYGSSESRIMSYSYTREGLEGVIEVLMKERDRMMADELDDEC